MIRIALGLVLIWYVYVGQRLLGTTALATNPLWWILTALPFLNVLWLPLFFWRDERPSTPRWQEWLSIAAFVWMGVLSLVLLCTLLRDLVFVVTRRPDLFGPTQSLSVVGTAVVLFVAGNWFARRTPRIVRVRVPIANLPAVFDRFTIAQISDLHIGHLVRKPFVERVVAEVNALKPDMIALTGDIFDGDPAKMRDDAEPLSGLKARDGRFYVTGNHEYYWDAPAWVKISGELGLTPLLNAHRVLERGKSKLVVAGVKDIWAARVLGNDEGADPVAALKGAPDEALVRILLAHQPQCADGAAAAGFTLQLSGHTHGGQFIPWVWVVGLFHHFVWGLHRHHAMWIYVSRGTGYWGPPLRLGAPSEITLLELVRE